VVTLKQGEGVVVVSELDNQQSRAISGVPGFSEIPGLNDLTGNDTSEERCYAHAADRDHAARDSRHTGRRPLADDARLTYAGYGLETLMAPSFKSSSAYLGGIPIKSQLPARRVTNPNLEI
jgi:hypothetical protein